MRLAAAAVLALCTPVFAQPDGSSAAATVEQGQAAATTHATPAPEQALLAGDRWMIRITPRVWYVAPSGDVRLPGSSGDVDVRTLDIDEPTLQPLGEVNVQAGDFLFSFSGGAAASHSKGPAHSGFTLGGISVSDGETYDMGLDLATFNLTAGYKVWQYVFKESARPGEHVLRVWALGGARLNSLDLDFSASGSDTSSSQTWFDAIGGVRVEAQFFESFSVDVECTAGGMTDSLSADITIALSWRPWDCVAVQAGYRILYLDFQDGSGSGETSYSGSMAGVFAGVTIRF